MAEGDRLARASVEITANTAGLDAAVAKAKTEVKGIGDAAKSTKVDADAMFQSMVNEAKAAEKATESASSAVKGMGLAVTGGLLLAFTAVYDVIASIVTSINKAKDEQKKLREEVQKSIESYEKMGDSIENILNPKDRVTKTLDAFRKIEDEALKLRDETDKKIAGGGYNRATRDRLMMENQARYEKTLNESAEAQRDYLRRVSQQSQNKYIEDKAKRESDAFERNFKAFTDQWDAERDHDEWRAKMDAERIANAEKLRDLAIAEAEARVRGIIDASNELRRLFDQQRAGFGAGDIVGSSSAANQALLNELRSLRSAIGGQ